MTTIDDQPEENLIEAAQGGDRKAFDALVASRRSEIHSHCYRMLASADDADDAVQETFVKAWKGLATFEQRSSFRTWLFKIATHSALDLAKARARRELPVGLGPATTEDPLDVLEIAWIGPYASDTSRRTPETTTESRESLELAYIVALQHLPARQRATFILREVVGFSASETAAILETSVATVTSSLQRARRSIDLRLPATLQRDTLRVLGDGFVRELASRYAAAIESADIRALMQLLTDDISWSMPPVPSWYHGRDAVGKFLERFVFPEKWRHRATMANDQLAVAGYIFDNDHGSFVPAAIDVLELRGDKIASVTGFLTGESMDERFGQHGLFERFGLPAEMH